MKKSITTKHPVSPVLGKKTVAKNSSSISRPAVDTQIFAKAVVAEYGETLVLLGKE